MAEKEYLPGGIKERLEDLRNRHKLTLKELSEKTGVDYSTLSRIENGNVKKVGDDVLLKLSRFFGVSTDFLLGITKKAGPIAIILGAGVLGLLIY